MFIPQYFSSCPLQAALHRIKNLSTNIRCLPELIDTMLKKVFHSNDYTMSLEVIDSNKKSKFDFLIERLIDQDKLLRHLYAELKKVEGDHFEKALVLESPTNLTNYQSINRSRSRV